MEHTRVLSATDRLHLVDLPLVLDDGAVELLLLRPQLQLQLPVLLLLPPHVRVVAPATPAAAVHLPVHDLCQLVDGLRTDTGAARQASRGDGVKTDSDGNVLSGRTHLSFKRPL